MGMARAFPPRLRPTRYKIALPAVCILLTANCQKHPVGPFPTLVPPPANAATAQIPRLESAPPLLEGDPTQLNTNLLAAINTAPQSIRIARSKSRLKRSAASNSHDQSTVPVDSLDVTVPIKSAAGVGTVNLATAIRDALNALTPSSFILECPARTRVGSTEKVRLTTKQDLTEMLTQKLTERGVPAEYLNGIITMAVADLTTDSSFAIQPEAAGPRSDTWAWRVEARQPGTHQLEPKVTLSARIPSRGEVEANAAVLSRVVAVDNEPFPPQGNFFDRYWLEMAGSVAGLMAAWLVWMLWRTRRSAFSHR
jgi:hypothetical protein